MNSINNANQADQTSIKIHRAEHRGKADFGWLKAKHSFSFGSYYDPKRMGFGMLRVLNDDIIAPTRGFDTHSHQDMEIVSIPLRGTLTHTDSMGNSSAIEFGEVQAMSAGSGVSHSEYNLSANEEVNLLQIWVLPEKLGIEPNYDQRHFDPSKREDRFQLVASKNGEHGSVQINQHASFHLFKAKTDDQQHFSLDLPLNAKQKERGSGVYLFVIEGSIELNDEFEAQILNRRDGAEISGIDKLSFTPQLGSELLLIQVPLGEN